MWLTVLLIVVGTALALVGLILLGVRLVKWARKNRAAAAEGMIGLYRRTDGSFGGDGFLEGFRTWLGEKIDAFSESGSSANAAHGGEVCGAAFDSAPTGDHCGGDSVCGGD